MPGEQFPDMPPPAARHPGRHQDSGQAEHGIPLPASEVEIPGQEQCRQASGEREQPRKPGAAAAERHSKGSQVERETRPPAFCAAASACAMKGLARCALDDRIRPGRMRKSSSPLIAETPHIASNR